MTRALMACCTLLGACATETNDVCENPVGLYRATVTWKEPACATPATTVRFLVSQKSSYDLDWTIEINPWNAKGTLDAVSGPAGCVELRFETTVGDSYTEHFEGWLLALDGTLPTDSLGGGGYRDVSGTAPCRGQFSLGYIVKESD